MEVSTSVLTQLALLQYYGPIKMYWRTDGRIDYSEEGKNWGGRRDIQYILPTYFYKCDRDYSFLHLLTVVDSQTDTNAYRILDIDRTPYLC